MRPHAASARGVRRISFRDQALPCRSRKRIAGCHVAARRAFLPNQLGFGRWRVAGGAIYAPGGHLPRGPRFFCAGRDLDEAATGRRRHRTHADRCATSRTASAAKRRRCHGTCAFWPRQHAASGACRSGKKACAGKALWVPAQMCVDGLVAGEPRWQMSRSRVPDIALFPPGHDEYVSWPRRVCI